MRDAREFRFVYRSQGVEIRSDVVLSLAEIREIEEDVRSRPCPNCGPGHGHIVEVISDCAYETTRNGDKAG